MVQNVIFNGVFSIVTTAIGVNASHNMFRGGDTHNAIMTDDWDTSPLRCHPIRTRAIIKNLCTFERHLTFSYYGFGLFKLYYSQ